MQKVRRSFATHLEVAGGNATEALLHSLRSITENRYFDGRGSLNGRRQMYCCFYSTRYRHNPQDAGRGDLSADFRP